MKISKFKNIRYRYLAYFVVFLVIVYIFPSCLVIHYDMQRVDRDERSYYFFPEKKAEKLYIDKDSSIYLSGFLHNCVFDYFVYKMVIKGACIPQFRINSFNITYNYGKDTIPISSISMIAYYNLTKHGDTYEMSGRWISNHKIINNIPVTISEKLDTNGLHLGEINISFFTKHKCKKIKFVSLSYDIEFANAYRIKETKLFRRKLVMFVGLPH